MPNPVAEVVARLRKAADNIERARMSGIVENLAGWEQRAVREAAECIAHLNAERLSRERDTGVPEIKTALGIAHAALTAHNDWHLKQIEPQTIDGMEIVPADAYCDSTLYELTQDALHHVERMEAKLSAAPQPPTVSTQGWQDISTAPRDGRWFLICREDEGPESYEVGCFDPQTLQRARSVLDPEKEEKA